MHRRAWPAHDGFVVALACAVAAGAWISRPLPPWSVVALLVCAVATRRPVVLLVAAVALASALGARGQAGMRAPAPEPVVATATLVTDPEREGASVRALVRVDGRHMEAWAYGEAGAVLEQRLAGERVHLRGDVSARPVPSWLQVRHVVCRIQVRSVAPGGSAHPLFAAANAVRRTLDRGARDLGAEPRALFTGLVVGDDRRQTEAVTDDFRGAGLTHLLAVSGQNVAFVLAVVGPVTRRLGFRGRLALVLAVLLLFATITRFEPSVLRATAMAVLATTAAAVGRPAASRRVLALAVACLLLIDPFLVRSVGFGLSVAASAGIVLWSDAVARAVPGPEVVRRSLGVVLAAQAGVAPLLLAVFGSIPVVSPVANLLAEPVAGLVMAWGSSAGLVAGLAPDGVAAAIHAPTSIALAWIAGVARWAAGAGFGELRGLTGGGVLAVGAAAVACRPRRPRLAGVLACAVVLALVLPAVELRRAHGPQHLAGVGTLWVGEPRGNVLALDAGARPETVLRAVRARGMDRIDAVVVRDDGASERAVVALLQRRITVARVEVRDVDSDG